MQWDPLVTSPPGHTSYATSLLVGHPRYDDDNTTYDDTTTLQLYNQRLPLQPTTTTTTNDYHYNQRLPLLPGHYKERQDVI